MNVLQKMIKDTRYIKKIAFQVTYSLFPYYIGQILLGWRGVFNLSLICLP